jgi:trehalose/maltose hydrolase-like predicted phosphorylase
LFLRQIRLDTFAAEGRLEYANVAGSDFPRGKPDPAIFLAAGDELGVRPGTCFVIEDATSGIQAAKAGKMAGLGVARLDDRQMLADAGADPVVMTLDDVSLDGLREGRLRERRVVAERRRRQTERPKSVWALQYNGFDAGRQGLREALCTLGNGYFATRGALAEAAADDVNYPGTYVAGLYNRLETEIAGRSVENEDLVNVPNWLTFAFRVQGGPWFDVLEADVLDQRVELDLAQGMLVRTVHWQDPAGRRTTMVQRRVVSMRDPHLASLDATFTAENWSGRLEIRSGLDGGVINAGVKRYRDLNGKHLDVRHAGEVNADTIELVAETNQSHIRIALAAQTRVVAPDIPEPAVERRVVRETGFVAHELSIALEQGHSVTVRKIVALYSSRDRPISESGLAARLAVENAPAFEELRARHVLAWSSLWNPFDIELDDGNEWTELVLHMHEFHLLQTVSPNTIGFDVGVPARGWHGEAYRGHIFWDEILTRSELIELFDHLGYDVTEEQLNQTVNYYLARTAHGSTLSGVVSTWVLARSDPKGSWKYLLQALESDIADVQGGTTAEGIHLGAMAGTVDIVQRRLTGMRAEGEVLRFDPALPAEVKQIRFSIHYRGHRIEIRLSPDEMHQLASRPRRADHHVCGETIDLAAGDKVRFALKPAS